MITIHFLIFLLLLAGFHVSLNLSVIGSFRLVIEKIVSSQ